MTDAVNIVGGGSLVAPLGQQQTISTAASVDSAAKSSDGNKTVDAKGVNSHLYVDPIAGGVLVTEQLNSDGSIAQQVPSAAVLAYLHDGLAIDGYPKHSTTA